MAQPGEIQHAEVIAERGEQTWHWSTPAGQQRATRRARLLIEAGHIGPNTRVLELGCGTGIFTAAFARTGAQIVAVDLSAVLLDLALAKALTGDITFRVEDAEQMSFDNEEFDAVVGSSILHHLDVDVALSEIHRVLRPQGHLAFAEPNMMNPHVIFERSTPAIRRRMGVSPEETAFFRRPLAAQLEQAGFDNVSVTPHDFVHPAVPGPLVSFVKGVGSVLEQMPLVREIAGSLLISAQRPAVFVQASCTAERMINQ